MTEYAKCTVCGYTVAIQDDANAGDYLCPVDGSVLVAATEAEHEHVLFRQVATFIVAASDSLHKERADYVCDGTDDQVEIMAAIDALPSRGGTVFLMEGYYYISAPIEITKPVDLIGQGCYNTYILLKPGANCDMIKFNLTSSSWLWRLANFTLDGNKLEQSVDSWGINMIGSHPPGDLLLFNVFVTNLRGNGIYINSWLPRLFNTYVEYCSGDGFVMGPGTSAGQLLRCVSRENDGNGIYVDSVHVNTGLVISDCMIDSNGKNGIMLESVTDGVERVSISGCIIYDNGRASADTYYGIDLVGDWGKAVGNIVIANNQIYNRTGHRQLYGIHANDWVVNHLIVTGNSFYHNEAGSILIPANVSCIIRGNFGDSTPPKYEGRSDLFMDVLAESINHVIAAVDLTAATPINCVIANQPDVPRNVTITITDTDASITAFQIEVAGIDAKGYEVSEVFTEAGGLTQTGNTAFATISSITVVSITGAGAGDTLDVGIGSKLGLSNIIYATGDVFKVKKNNANYASANYTVNTTYDTVDVSTGGAITGGDDFTIYYKSNLNIVS